MRTMILLLAISFGIFAQSDTKAMFDKLAGIPAPGLAKTSAIQATSYSNATFNMKYTAPAGWSFVTPTPGASGVSMQVTSTLYPAIILIGALYRTDPIASSSNGPSWCYQMHNLCFSKNVSQVTYGYAVLDTTYSNTGNHFSWQKIKFLDDHSLIQCDYVVQSGSYSLTVSYATTVADYTLNDPIYFKHVQNLTWYSSTTFAKTSQGSYRISRESTLDNIFDLRGRMQAMENPTEKAAKAPQVLVNQNLGKILGLFH